MASNQDRREQRIIEHEVLLSRTRAIIQDYLVARQERADARAATEQNAWMRTQVSDMIARASADELEGLGLTDELMRELRLGTSVQGVWTALHSAPRASRLRSPRGFAGERGDDPGGAGGTTGAEGRHGG